MKLDHKLTSAIQDWLNTPSETRDVMAGADMALAVTRNRALYNTFLRNPKKFMPKIEYELRKHLNIRLHDMSAADVARLEGAVMPAAEETVSSMPVISSEDEIAPGRKGRRPDHDSLPEEVRRLWDDNIDRGRRIVLLFNECKAMADAQPCDRFEKVKMLGDLDRDYRMAMSKYDSYVPGMPFSGFGESPSKDSAKAVNSARKTISTYKGRLSGLAQDDPKREVYIDKINEAVRAVAANGGSFTPEYAEELRSMGVSMPS